MMDQIENISASFEKVENVVKPPQRPTVSASCRLSLQPILEHNPPRNPIAKLPMTLIATVAHGKKHDGKISPITYRNRLPNPPAKNIKMKFIALYYITPCILTPLSAAAALPCCCCKITRLRMKELLPCA